MVEDTQSQPTTVADSKPGADESIQAQTDVFVPEKPAEDYIKLWRDAGLEAKKARQALVQTKKELADERARIEALEAATMKAGDHESAWKKEKAKREQIETELKTFKANSAFREVSSQFEREAMKRGCVDPKALVTLASAHGVFNELMIDEHDLSVSPDSLKTAIERAEKDWNYLFTKRAPQFRDGVPATSSTITNKQPEFAKLKSADEIIAWARANQNKLS